MNKSVVLKDTKYHEETKILSNDPILIQMANEIPINFNIDQIPFKRINDEYLKRGGKANPMTIGSLKLALKEIRSDK